MNSNINLESATPSQIAQHHIDLVNERVFEGHVLPAIKQNGTITESTQVLNEGNTEGQFKLHELKVDTVKGQTSKGTVWHSFFYLDNGSNPEFLCRVISNPHATEDGSNNAEHYFDGALVDNVREPVITTVEKKFTSYGDMRQQDVDAGDADADSDLTDLFGI